MRVYAGTYQGHVLILEGEPTSLNIKSNKAISENSIRTLRISGPELLVGGYDQELKSVNAITGVQQKQSKESLGIINCICNAGERMVAVGLETGTIRFWDRESWNVRKDLKEHKKAVKDIKIDAKGLMLVSIAGKEMIFWNVDTLKSLYHYKFDFELEHLLLVDSFEYLFLLGDRTIRQLSTENNQQLFKLDLTEKIQCGLIFSTYLIIATEKGFIRIWSHGNFNHSIYFKASQARIKDVKSVSLDEVDYLVTADCNGQISVWDVLQFLKSVDSISQDYPLQGLKPIGSCITKQRIICLEVSAINNTTKKQQIPKKQKKQEQQKVKVQPKQKNKKIHKLKHNSQKNKNK